jgi:two-component system sensor histidine kinase DesK
VLCGFLVVEIIDILISPMPSHGLERTVGMCSVVCVFLLQIFNSSPTAARWPLRRRLAMLFAQGLVTYLPLVILGAEWGGMAGFLAGSILLLLPGWSAWGLFAAVVGSMLFGPLALGLPPSNVAYLAVSTLDIGLVVFGLSRLSLIVRYVHATRGEHAQLAIVRERMRFARDLHDLLGYSLSAITLKAELARRLVSSNPGRARDETAELLDIARQALADVRLVARGYRNISLAKETSSVSSLLAAADIQVQMDIMAGGALDERVDTVMATVLREGVTNVLRHSSARNCSIETSEAGGVLRLRIANDGVTRAIEGGARRGGLENLSLRLAAIGGRLTTTIDGDRHFALLAEAPLIPPEAVSGTEPYL